MIKPEDHRPAVKTEINLPAELFDRLIVYAANLKHPGDPEGRASTPNYVIRTILDEQLPKLSTAATPKRQSKRVRA